jgi:hypothetical protein
LGLRLGGEGGDLLLGMLMDFFCESSAISEGTAREDMGAVLRRVEVVINGEEDGRKCRNEDEMKGNRIK